MPATKNANPIIGENIRRIRKREGLTQQALAERLGMATSNLNKIENTGTVYAHHLVAICAELHCSPEEILPSPKSYNTNWARREVEEITDRLHRIIGRL